MLYEAVNVGDQKAWCGPTVVAAITGLAVPSVKARIKRIRGHNGAVRGTHNWEIRRVLEELGYRMAQVPVAENAPSATLPGHKQRPSLARWLRWSRDMEAAYIVVIREHYVVVKGRWFCDTYTKGIPVRATKAPHRRARVLQTFKVTPR